MRRTGPALHRRRPGYRAGPLPGNSARVIDASRPATSGVPARSCPPETPGRRHAFAPAGGTAAAPQLGKGRMAGVPGPVDGPGRGSCTRPPANRRSAPLRDSPGGRRTPVGRPGTGRRGFARRPASTPSPFAPGVVPARSPASRPERSPRRTAIAPATDMAGPRRASSIPGWRTTLRGPRTAAGHALARPRPCPELTSAISGMNCSGGPRGPIPPVGGRRALPVDKQVVIAGAAGRGGQLSPAITTSPTLVPMVPSSTLGTKQYERERENGNQSTSSSGCSTTVPDRNTTRTSRTVPRVMYQGPIAPVDAGPAAPARSSQCRPGSLPAGYGTAVRRLHTDRPAIAHRHRPPPREGCRRHPDGGGRQR